MTNKEKYDKVFTESFTIGVDELPNLTYQSVQLWDSVGHMTLISALEDAFDIMFETDDIIDLSSYEKGIDILTKNYNVQF